MNFVLLQVNDELCRLMGVQCNITSAYHPQSNGLDERFNQTLQRQLLKYVNEDQNDWDLYLDAILFSYRVSRQSSTKASPFVLVYGRQPQLPVEFSLTSTVENGAENRKHEEGTNMNPEVSSGYPEGEEDFPENENSESPMELTRHTALTVNYMYFIEV